MNLKPISRFESNAFYAVVAKYSYHNRERYSKLNVYYNPRDRSWYDYVILARVSSSDPLFSYPTVSLSARLDSVCKIE